MGGIAGFENRSALIKREEMADFRFMLAFGFGFITVMFLGFLTGFCLGKFLLGWNENDSLLLSLVTGIPTLFLEAFLMMIRLNKWERKREAERLKQARGPNITINEEVVTELEEKAKKPTVSKAGAKSSKSKPKAKAKTE